ncbi:MAG: sugar ABC transporter ATP-binding protein [Christensenella sp.]
MQEEYILKATDIIKSFAGVKALQGVNLDIKKGEIHCLAGENGCGKSTLIKIISGVYSLDSGKVEFNGVDQTHHLTPINAIMNGIQVIYQDFSIFPNLSVMENLAYNSELMQKRKIVNWKRFRKIAEEAVSKINFEVDLDEKVGVLPVADKQLVAISRALINNAKLIIMDEPTTALTKREVEALFKIIKDLQAQGIAILFVSHKLDEVFEISERFTILRNGQNVKDGDTSELNSDKFTYYMTGRHFENEHFVAEVKDEKPVLEVHNLSCEGDYEDVSFDLRKGEILGITGLLGSGRTELALSLFGIKKPTSGKIVMNGKEIKLTSVKEAMKNGIGYVPEDRLTEGLFLDQSIGRNIVISELKNFASKIGIIDQAKRAEEIQKWIKELKIKVADSDQPASTLSGGNQQRIVLAKWMATHPNVLILNGPTVGVDIGSKYDMHAILHNLAKGGLGIIIISDDLPEVITHCSRVLIMRGGRITGEVDPLQITETELAKQVTDVIVNG